MEEVLTNKDTAYSSFLPFPAKGYFRNQTMGWDVASFPAGEKGEYGVL